MGQLSYTDDVPFGHPGQIVESGSVLARTNGAVGIQTELLVVTAQNTTLYTFSFNGHAFTYTSSGAATKTEISTAFRDALRASPEFSGAALFELAGAPAPNQDLLFRAFAEGQTFDLAESDANLAITVIDAGGEPDSIKFGSLLISGGDGTVVAPSAANCPAYVLRGTPQTTGFQAVGAIHTVTVEYWGLATAIDSQTVTLTGSTAQQTDVDALITALGLVVPTHLIGFSRTGVTTDSVLNATSQVPGMWFNMSGSYMDMSPGILIGSGGLPLEWQTMGIAAWNGTAPATTEAPIGYEAFESVATLANGLAYVDVDNSDGQFMMRDVWFGVSIDPATDTRSRWRDSPTLTGGVPDGDYVKLPPHRYQWVSFDANNSIALLRVNQ